MEKYWKNTYKKEIKIMKKLLHVYFITGRGSYCQGTVLVVAESIIAALELCNGLSESNDKDWGIDFKDYPCVIEIHSLMCAPGEEACVPRVLASEFSGK